MQPKNLTLLFFLFVFSALHPILHAQTNLDFSRTLDGSVGQYKISMRLRRTGNDLSGTYEYVTARPRQINFLDLQGKVDRAGNFTLQEMDPNGKATGTFKGRLPADLAKLRLEGTWTKTGSQQTLPFTLTEGTLTMDGQPLQIIYKDLKEEKKAIKYLGEAHYPQITGSTDPRVVRLNRDIENLVKKGINGFAKDLAENYDPQMLKELDPEAQTSSIDIDAEMVTATDNLFSVFFAEMTYNAGAAHPNHGSSVINYDLRTGRLLRLADLFKPRSNYLSRISQICIGVFKKDKVSEAEWVERGAGANAENYQSWNITPHGLLITFDPYQVASYAEGRKEIIIPYSALTEIIDPAGPLAALVR